MYTAKIILERDDVKHLEKAMDKNIQIKGRATANLKIEKGKMIIDVKAKDASSFRAALNSYLRILQSTENIVEV